MYVLSNCSKFFILFVLFLFIAQASLAEQIQQQEPLSEEQKLEQVKSYFESEYQEEDFFRTDRLLLTATGSLMPVHKAPSVATVITAEDIERIGARTLNEALEIVPGLHVSVSNKDAMSPIYLFRGIHTSVNPQVLMMINSIPIKSEYYGRRPHMIFPVASIARIEVVRGPGSAVYGADAFAGTINIITKEGKDIEGSSIGGGGGSFDTYEGWFQHGNTYNGWDMAFSLEYLTSRGDDDRIVDFDLQSMFDGLFSTAASHAPSKLDLGYKVYNANLSLIKDNWTLRFWTNNMTNENGDGVTSTLDKEGDKEIEEFLADLSYQTSSLAEDLALSSRLSFHYYKQDTKLQLFPDGSVLLIGPDGNIDFSPAGVPVSFPGGVWGEPVQIEKQTAMEITGLYEGFTLQRLRVSSGFTYNKAEYEEYKNFGPGVLENPKPSDIQGDVLTDVTGTDYIFSPDKIRKLWYISLQDEWTFAKKWELTAGVRYDKYNDFGSTINPRLALVWETRPDLTSKLLYGSAFRPPALYELYTTNNPSNTGNPDLEPETIDTLELVFDYQPTSYFRSIFSLFGYEIHDLIELDTTTLPNTTQNARDTEGYGFEIEMDWGIATNLHLRGNIAYQRSKDKDTNDIIPDAPGLQVYLNPTWDFMPGWSIDAQYFWIGNRHRDRTAGDTRPEIDDYSLVNLTLRRKNIAQHWDFALMVRNLFDEDIREPSQAAIPNDYPMEGRSVFGEVRLHF